MGILPLAGIEPQFPSHLARRMFTLGRLIESVAVHSDRWWNREPAGREIHFSDLGTCSWSSWPAELTLRP